MCGSEPGDIELPSITKVTGGPGIRDSDLLRLQLSKQLDHRRFQFDEASLQNLRLGKQVNGELHVKVMHDYNLLESMNN